MNEWKHISNQDILSIVLDNKIPEDTIQYLFHEFSSYWMKDSPVGRAIKALRLEYIHNAINPTNHENTRMKEELNIQASYITSIEFLLRTVTEGLAWFVEYDFQPTNFPRGHGSVLTLLAILVTNNNYPMTNRSLDQVGRYIKQIRFHDKNINRKVKLFTHPMSSEKIEEGDFIGYIFIKQLYKLIQKKSNGCIDAEFFIKYIRSYIYEDWGLVKLLLNKWRNSIELESRYIQVFSHLKDRLNRLNEHCVCNNMLIYEKRVLEMFTSQNHYTQLDWESLPGLNQTQEDVIVGINTLNAFINNLDFNFLPEEVKDLFNNFGASTVLMDDILLVFIADIWIKIKSNRNIEIYSPEDKKTVLSKRKILFDGGQIQGKGKLEVYTFIVSGRPVLLQVIKFNKKIVGLWSKEKINKAIIQFIWSKLEIDVIIKKYLRETYKLDCLLNNSHQIIDIQTKTMKNSGYNVTQYYKSYLLNLGGIGESLVLKCFPRNDVDNGLGEILQDPEVLKSYSLFSVANTYTKEKFALEHIFNERGKSLNELLHHLDRICKEKGIKLYVDYDSNLVAEL